MSRKVQKKFSIRLNMLFCSYIRGEKAVWNLDEKRYLKWQWCVYSRRGLSVVHPGMDPGVCGAVFTMIPLQGMGLDTCEYCS